MIDLESASIRGRLPAAEHGPFALLTEPAPGVFAVTPIPSGASFALAGVPASDGARLLAWRAGTDRHDPRTWRELRTFSLPAGVTTTVE